ncbi:MAG: sulfate/molybdate ABC transporter ATP-binding protein [Acidimicrobiales bacterium]
MSLLARVAVRLGDLDLAVDLAVPSGEVVAVLGRNGAGKTTLLRAVAGLIPLAEGRVEVDGEVLDDPGQGIHVPTARRPIGVVFQDYLLFAHLTVLDNVAFGLRARGVPRRDARATAATWLGRVGLGGRASARPRSLSGGQAQRVALARALATEPRLLLLDEPLAALDATTRVEMRAELRRQLAGFGGTRLLVTHDPLDAIVLADRLVVLESGRITHDGTIPELSARPRSSYVAELVGLNLWRGTARDDIVEVDGGGELTIAGHERGPVFVTVRPRAVAVHGERPHGSPRNVWPVTVDSIEVVGDRVRVRLAGAPPAIAEITPAAVAELGLDHGSRVWASVKATELDIYPA